MLVWFIALVLTNSVVVGYWLDTFYIPTEVWKKLSLARYFDSFWSRERRRRRQPPGVNRGCLDTIPVFFQQGDNSMLQAIIFSTRDLVMLEHWFNSRDIAVCPIPSVSLLVSRSASLFLCRKCCGDYFTFVCRQDSQKRTCFADCLWENLVNTYFPPSGELCLLLRQARLWGSLIDRRKKKRILFQA